MTHASAIAARLQHAHQQREREDEDMATKDATTEQVQQFGSGIWDDDPELQAIRKIGEELASLRREVAELRAGAEPQASAVTAERVVELERQLREAQAHREEAVAENERLARRLEANGRKPFDNHEDCYVAREVPWSDVAAGMMTIARDGTPWMVRERLANGQIILANGPKSFEKLPTDGETVRVLVPYVTPDQAEELVRSQLGERA